MYEFYILSRVRADDDLRFETMERVRLNDRAKRFIRIV